MPHTINYYRRADGAKSPLTPCGRAAVVLATLSGVCLVLPFGLFHLSGQLNPARPEQGAIAVLIPTLMLWLAAGILSTCGTATGVLALRQNRPSFLTIAATTLSGVILLISLAAVVRGLLQHFRHGWNA